MPHAHSQELQDEKFTVMTTQPIGPLITRMAIPAILSIMTSAIYNLADSWFVSQVGEGATRAVAALGVIFSYQTICNAVGFFFGHGSGKLMGSLYLFAPAGGSIANCSSDSGSLRSSEYRGLSLVTQDVVLLPEASVVIECEVTTSAAAEAPLSVMQMPTAQGYRD
jgi:hypothetical protein